MNQTETHETLSATKQRGNYEEAIHNMITYAHAQGAIGGDAKGMHVCSLIETLNAYFEQHQHGKKQDPSETNPKPTPETEA